MIFRRRKKASAEEQEVATGETTAVGTADGSSGSDPSGADPADAAGADAHTDEQTDENTGEQADEQGSTAEALTHLDEVEWRTDGPHDVTEIDLEAAAEDDPRIDLGSMIITGFAGAELRLQVAEETQQIVSAMLIGGDSALELGAYAAPRSGGFWPELRAELAEATTEAGGSVAFVEGPFGVELRRLMPVTTPDGEQGYQPSRMWVAEGPRWLLRGILYGQAALEEGLDGPVEPLLDAFRQVIVRRDDQAMSPGDQLPLRLPEDLTPADPGADDQPQP